MNMNETKTLMRELKNGISMEKNLKIVDNLISGNNAWNYITKELQENEYIKERFDKVAGKLSEEGCFSYGIHVSEFIKELVDELDNNEEKAFDRIFDKVYWDNDDIIEDSIKLLTKLKESMNYKDRK